MTTLAALNPFALLIVGAIGVVFLLLVINGFGERAREEP